MSYRDLRNFTEMLRTLGYPNLISMESFRNPNFPLVAEIIVWLAKRLDSEADIPSECNTEDERVTLIRASAQFMALKANIKLNTKRLYQADGYAVKELIKVATLLYDALRNSDLANIIDEEDGHYLSLKEFDIADKVNELKQARQLSSEITTNGAALYDLLGKEVDLRALRHISVGRQFEINEVENGVKKATEAVRKQIEETKQLIDNVSNSEASLDSKIERRKVELDRYEKRLQTLKKVKPAFLEDFTKAEQEMQQLYEQYVMRYRCKIYLEQRFAEVERVETERMQQHLIATRKLVEQLRLEEHLPEEVSTLEALTENGDQEMEEGRKTERPKAKPDSRARPIRSKTSIGNSVLETTSGSSTESDSEDILLDGEEPELLGSGFGSEDDSIAVEISTMDNRDVKRAPTAGRRTVQQRRDDSDDDF